MYDDELMTIGPFARLSQVSVHALRHYDEVGLLRPAEIDPASGYRRYRRTQIHAARLIQVLRGLDLSIDEIKPMLTAGSHEVRAMLVKHRHRLAREHQQLAARIDRVDRFLQEGIIVPTAKTSCRPVQFIVPADDTATAIAFYRTAFDFPYDVIRTTKQKDYKSFAFGKYGEHDYFFMLHVHGPERHSRPKGPVTFGLLVDDLDAYRDRALAAGARRAGSAVVDPSGNHVELVQAWPGFESGCRPILLKLAADDRKASIAFYQAAFGLTYDDSSFAFGEYGNESFFRLQLVDDPGTNDRPGLTAFSFLVDDLDAYHAKALAAGGDGTGRTTPGRRHAARLRRTRPERQHDRARAGLSHAKRMVKP